MIARAARLGGMFTGSSLNDSEDNLRFARFADRWLNRYLSSREGGESVDAGMDAGLRAFLEREWAVLPSAGTPWGWKEPRTIFLLPFLHGRLPSLRFVHVVRDGRDMAFSENQNQVRKHGRQVLSDEEWAGEEPLRSIRLWSLVNAAAADYGEEMLGEQYLRVRFEDLCADPARVLDEVLSFFGVDAGAAQAVAGDVRPPPSVGRWRVEPEALLAELELAAGATLRRFGYGMT